MRAANGSRSISTATRCARRRASWCRRPTCPSPATAMTARKPRRQPPSTSAGCILSSSRSSGGLPTWTTWASTCRRSRPRRTRPITACPPTWRSRRPGSSTTTSPRSAANIPTASPGSAPCRSRRRSWRLPSWSGCTARSASGGIEIAGSVQGEDYSERKFWPIFAKCEELGLVLFMHPTGFTETRRMGPWHLGNLIGNPLESTVAVHHLIFGGVLDHYPGLKLVVAHGGGFLPAYSGRIDHAAAARPDTCEHLHHDPTHYLKRMYFDTMVFTHHQLEYLVKTWGADHILMGTDYPFDMGEVDPIGFVEGAARLSDGDRKAILGGNAARLLNLPIRLAQGESA